MDNRRWDPITGGSSALMSTVVDLTSSLVGIFAQPVIEVRKGREQNARIAQKMRPRPSANASSSSIATSSSIASSSSIATSAHAFDQKDGNLGSDHDKAPSVKGSVRSDRSSRPNGMALAGRAAGASAKSFAQFPVSALKAMTVDIPHAMTEGLHNVPRYYGEKVRDHGQVTGFKSGAVVGAKNFVFGFADGLSDVVTKPYVGARDGGALGAVIGVGKGLGNLTAKTGSAMFGVITYPSAGIAKSIRASVHKGTRKVIEERRLEEGRWLMEQRGSGKDSADTVITRFKELKVV